MQAVLLYANLVTCSWWCSDIQHFLCGVVYSTNNVSSNTRRIVSSIQLRSIPRTRSSQLNLEMRNMNQHKLALSDTMATNSSTARHMSTSWYIYIRLRSQRKTLKFMFIVVGNWLEEAMNWGTKEVWKGCVTEMSEKNKKSNFWRNKCRMLHFIKCMTRLDHQGRGTRLDPSDIFPPNT